MRFIRLLPAALAAALPMVVLTIGGVAPSASGATGGLIVWAPAEQAAVIADQLVDGFRGEPVTVVVKDAAAIRADLGTVDVALAPDVIWGEAVWTGQLVADRMVRRLPLSAATRAQFPARLLDAFRYGFADYGLPVTVANEAMITNLSLVPTPPATFRALERTAGRLMASGAVTVGLAVGQGEAGRESLLGPLFTGLGGYLFGKNPAGGLDPYNVGLSSPALQAHARRIDAWNDAGLVSAGLRPAQAQRAFVTGGAAFWITGPDSRPVIDALPFDVAITAVPAIVPGIAALPFLAVEGPMVTVYADRRGVGDMATALVRRHFGSPAVQAALARATTTAPALLTARVSADVADFAAAGAGGIPLPNITQAAALWGPFRQAWARSTAGASAIPAGSSFALAQKSVLIAIG